jgi:NADH-quinone oxidoreductase subunit G/[NiFe] hydrogenase diaphorase moiety small subunit/NADP-reducing hydrogenase subunit HndD
MASVKININDMIVEAPEGATILEAARSAKIKIPTLCHHDDLCVAGNCRVCVVEVEGARTLQAACATPVADNMKVQTNSLKVRKARKDIIDLLLSEHAGNCTTCYKNGKCELQEIASEYASPENPYLDISVKKPIDKSSPSIQKDDSKCIKCQRCVRTCADLQNVNALTMAHKGHKVAVETFFNLPLNSVVCTNCGQCINRCPTGALVERNHIEEVWDALGDESKHVVVQTAPSVRVGLGEYLGLNAGERVTGKMVAALKRLGFDAVFDTNFTADLTIMEEGTELLTRLKNALVDKKEVALPMMTSCSPGWIKYIEHMFPEHLDHLSTCKSPQQMFGPLAKTYYAEKAKINPADMIVISIMPCTAKKFEADRPEMNASGFKDVDYVLTTRELAFMIKQAGIDFSVLEEEKCDSLLGEHTGAGAIFGATGGVMEAALRTAYEIVTGREVPFDNLNIMPVRGMEGIKEASIKIEGTTEAWSFLEGAELKVAISHGLKNAKPLMKQVEAGESPYHFVEVMACPGGCIGGGGQPIPTNMEIRKLRTQAIYDEDMGLPMRKSHENPEVARLYEEFLTKGPLGHKSHELLHTEYTKRTR